MINVDAGNSPHRAENPTELRRTWRLTWVVTIGFLLFVLLFVGIRLLSGADKGGAAAPTEQREGGGAQHVPRPIDSQSPRS